MKLAALKVDVGRIEAGAWIACPDLPGVELFCRGERNSRWIELEDKILSSKARYCELMFIPVEMRRLSERAKRDMTIRLYLETCLIDWRGLESDDGEPLPYSPDMARVLMTDPAYRAFADAVAFAAGAVAGPV